MAWIRDVALLAVVFTVFMAGRNMGRQEVEGRWNAQKLQTAQQIASQERDYANQLQAARNQAVENRRELDSLRAAAHPRLLCTRPGVPASTPGSSAPGEPPGAGTLSPDAGFDPTERLYRDVADAADDIIEQCRIALSSIPHR